MPFCGQLAQCLNRNKSLVRYSNAKTAEDQKAKSARNTKLGNVSYKPKIFHVIDGTESESASFDDVLAGLYASLHKKHLDLSDPSVDLYAPWNM